MQSHKSNRKKLSASDGPTGLARPLAPEEIRPGDYVAMLLVVVEYPSFLWCDDATLLPRDEPRRMRFVPHDEPQPLKVEAVCLPYVLGRTPKGAAATLDVRRVRLARLDPEFAAQAWKAYSGKGKSGKRRNNKKKQA